MKKFLLLMMLGAMLFMSCVRNKNPQQMQQSVIQTNQKVFEVNEVIQGSSYTYLNVKENMMNKWVAVSYQEINKGDVFYYDGALEMNNFHSKEIDRTFETIYFVSQISKTPLAENPMMGGGMTGGMPAHTGKVEFIFKGKLTLDKNFGLGYFYEVILEDGKLVNKEISML